MLEQHSARNADDIGILVIPFIAATVALGFGIDQLANGDKTIGGILTGISTCVLLGIFRVCRCPLPDLGAASYAASHYAYTILSDQFQNSGENRNGGEAQPRPANNV